MTEAETPSLRSSSAVEAAIPYSVWNIGLIDRYLVASGSTAGSVGRTSETLKPTRPVRLAVDEFALLEIANEADPVAATLWSEADAVDDLFRAVAPVIRSGWTVRAIERQISADEQLAKRRGAVVIEPAWNVPVYIPYVGVLAAVVMAAGEMGENEEMKGSAYWKPLARRLGQDRTPPPPVKARIFDFDRDVRCPGRDHEINDLLDALAERCSQAPELHDLNLPPLDDPPRAHSYINRIKSQVQLRTVDLPKVFDMLRGYDKISGGRLIDEWEKDIRIFDATSHAGFTSHARDVLGRCRLDDAVNRDEAVLNRAAVVQQIERRWAEFDLTDAGRTNPAKTKGRSVELLLSIGKKAGSRRRGAQSTGERLRLALLDLKTDQLALVQPSRFRELLQGGRTERFEQTDNAGRSLRYDPRGRDVLLTSLVEQSFVTVGRVRAGQLCCLAGERKPGSEFDRLTRSIRSVGSGLRWFHAVGEDPDPAAEGSRELIGLPAGWGLVRVTMHGVDELRANLPQATAWQPYVEKRNPVRFVVYGGIRLGGTFRRQRYLTPIGSADDQLRVRLQTPATLDPVTVRTLHNGEPLSETVVSWRVGRDGQFVSEAIPVPPEPGRYTFEAQSVGTSVVRVDTFPLRSTSRPSPASSPPASPPASPSSSWPAQTHGTSEATGWLSVDSGAVDSGSVNGGSDGSAGHFDTGSGPPRLCGGLILGQWPPHRSADEPVDEFVAVPAISSGDAKTGAIENAVEAIPGHSGELPGRERNARSMPTRSVVRRPQPASGRIAERRALLRVLAGTSVEEALALEGCDNPRHPRLRTADVVPASAGR